MGTRSDLRIIFTPEAKTHAVMLWTETCMRRSLIAAEIERMFDIRVTPDQVGWMCGREGGNRPIQMTSGMNQIARQRALMDRRTLEAFQAPLQPVRPETAAQRPPPRYATPGGYRMAANIIPGNPIHRADDPPETGEAA